MNTNLTPLQIFANNSKFEQILIYEKMFKIYTISTAFSYKEIEDSLFQNNGNMDT